MTNTKKASALKTYKSTKNFRWGTAAGLARIDKKAAIEHAEDAPVGDWDEWGYTLASGHLVYWYYPGCDAICYVRTKKNEWEDAADYFDPKSRDNDDESDEFWSAVEDGSRLERECMYESEDDDVPAYADPNEEYWDAAKPHEEYANELGEQMTAAMAHMDNDYCNEASVHYSCQRPYKTRNYYGSKFTKDGYYKAQIRLSNLTKAQAKKLTNLIVKFSKSV